MTPGSRRAVRVLVLVAVLGATALGASACSSAAPQATYTTVVAGQIPRSEVADIGGRLSNGTANTVPLAQQNPVTALFTALGTFQTCLKGLGVTFVGAPNPKDPSSPANNPSYLKDLGTCAAKSDIINALKAAQSSQDNLTLKQIQNENHQYLKWRKCMISRGWGIPVPVPNSKGLLFSFGGSGGSSAPAFKPPPGQSLFNSPDLQACADQVAAQSAGG